VQDSSIPRSSASEPASRNPQRTARMSAVNKACQQLIHISVTYPLPLPFLSIFVLLSPMHSSLVARAFAEIGKYSYQVYVLGWCRFQGRGVPGGCRESTALPTTLHPPVVFKDKHA
jgi:hypothetical protein